MRLGRFPLAGGIMPYAESKRGQWNPDTTLPEEMRKLRQIAGEFEDLHREGKIPSTDPRKLEWPHIQIWIETIRRLDPDVQAAQILRLNGMLKFFENYCIQYQLDRSYRLPRTAHRTIRVIEEEDLDDIFEAVERIPGWCGSVARGMVAIYFATGVRPSELRTCHIQDLDLRKERLFVRHPKGEGNWASPEWVDLIRGDVMPMVRRYVDERAAFLASEGRSKGIELFPKQVGSGFYSANRFRMIKQKIVKEAGVDFMLKDFRPTLTSMTVNEDPSLLPEMSWQLRHASYATTERFYTRIKRSRAGRKLKEMWKRTRLGAKSAGSINAKITAIDSDNEVTG